MKRLLGAACAVGLLATGCASTATSAPDTTASAVSMAPRPSASLDTAPTQSPAADAASGREAVDAVVNHFIAFTVTMASIPSTSTDETLRAMQSAQEDMAAAADVIRPGIPGVPTEVSDAVYTSVVSTEGSMIALISCLAAGDRDCKAESATAGEDAKDLGIAVVNLIPFGSRTEDEFLAEVDGTSAAAASAASGDPRAGATSDDIGEESLAETNAREKALEYLGNLAFSRESLIRQLEFDGFSSTDATYGVDALDVDWNSQAELKAQEYLDYTTFSRKGLIAQLMYEGFTKAQARHGADSVGL